MSRIVLLVLSVSASLAYPPAAREAAAARLNYTLYVLGVPVADAVMTVDLASNGYAMDLSFHTTGIARLFSGDRMDTRSRGLIEHGRLVPMDYMASGRLRGQDRVAGLVWHHGMPDVTTLDPPVAAERTAVPPPARAGTIDPLAAMAVLIRDVAQTGHCDDSTRTFDGRKLEEFVVRTGGEADLPRSIHSNFAGPGMRCTFVRRVLAGSRFGADAAEDSRTRVGTIWLGPVLPGLPRMPMRAVVETQWLGDATIYLTGAVP